MGLEWLVKNPHFAESEDILYIGKDKVLYSEWMKRSLTEFTSEFFASHNQWMRSEENASFVSSIVNDYDTVIKFLIFLGIGINSQGIKLSLQMRDFAHY